MPLPSGTWSIATIEVDLRDGKFTYCRPYMFNPLTTDDAFCVALSDFSCMSSVGASCFEDRFLLTKKVG